MKRSDTRVISIPADAPSWAYSVLEEEHEERTAPEAREVTDAEVAAARAVIVALAPYNMELRPDGSEDREAASYVSGVQAASDAIPRALAAAAAVRS